MWLHEQIKLGAMQFHDGTSALLHMTTSTHHEIEDTTESGMDVWVVSGISIITAQLRQLL